MYCCYFQSQPYTIGTILSVPGVTATVDPAANIDINNSSQIASEVADLSMGSRKRSHPACKFFLVERLQAVIIGREEAISINVQLIIGVT